MRALRNGATVRLGNTEVAPHFTPGHTPGSTTWTWSAGSESRCLHVVYADSLNAISAPGFHYLADETHADLTALFRHSIGTVAALPCDILISVHPDVAGVDVKLQQLRAKPLTHPFIDSGACRRYADQYDKMLDARIAAERSAAAESRQ